MLKINQNGDRFWNNEKDELHREDGPAVEYRDGSKHWYVNGEIHREDGPACEYTDGTKCWYVNGNRHRINGPAIERLSGYKEYWLNDKKYTEEEYKEKVRKYVRN